MKNRKSLLPFVIVAVAVLAGLFWWLRPLPASAPAAASDTMPATSSTAASAAPSEKPRPTNTRFDFVIEHRQLVSGPPDMKVLQGSTITLHVRTDDADELHLHGYDLEAQLRPGETGELKFVADRAGRFPLELHHAHLELGVLEVFPSF